MSGTQSLTGLCAVCYAEQPKYKCPRCKMQTCSLPCYKKHQQRASCNGQRDPAAFVKKSQWATAAGIDHDYNYLKSVERQIEKTSDEVKSLTAADGGKKNNQWQGDSSLQKYLQQHDIIVEKAPIGMSRSRMNKTRVTGKGNVFWTVEWVHEDGKSDVVDDSAAATKLHLLYAAVSARRMKQRQAEVEQEIDLRSASKKRRIDDVDTTHATSNPGEDLKLKQADSSKAESKQPSATATKHFYLGRPGSSSGTKLVIPLDPQHTLTEALSGRKVQEYPTIYVLLCAVEDLPSTYQTEESYLKAQAANNEKQLTLPTAPSVPTPALPDSARIIEMLRRDIHTT